VERRGLDSSGTGMSLWGDIANEFLGSSKVKGKVKLCLCLTKHHSMKPY
jgi:hypothetical protein